MGRCSDVDMAVLPGPMKHTHMSTSEKSTKPQWRDASTLMSVLYARRDGGGLGLRFTAVAPQACAVARYSDADNACWAQVRGGLMGEGLDRKIVMTACSRLPTPKTPTSEVIRFPDSVRLPPVRLVPHPKP